MSHKRPTKEELQQGMKESLAELETLPPETPPEPTPPTPTPPVTPKKEEPSVVTPPVEPTPPVTPPPTPTPPVTPKKEEPIDWEKKFKASSREAQVIGFKNKEISQAVDQASELAEPTDEDMKKDFSDWDDMTPTEQRLAKDSALNKKKFELIHNATSKFKKVDEWNETIDGFTADPQTLIAYPELEGKIEEFKEFASKPSRRGLDPADLVLAFNGDLAKKTPPPKKTEMFPDGSGGPPTPPPKKDNRLSFAEGQALMASNYEEYKRKLSAGQIKDFDEA